MFEKTSVVHVSFPFFFFPSIYIDKADFQIFFFSFSCFFVCILYACCRNSAVVASCFSSLEVLHKLCWDCFFPPVVYDWSEWALDSDWPIFMQFVILCFVLQASKDYEC